MALGITIRTIPHNEQSYQTSGNWWFTPDLEVRVSNMGNDKFESLVGVHETIEALLCRAAGIDEEDVSKFDKLYEDARPDNINSGTRISGLNKLAELFGCDCEPDVESEPGDDIHAPYYRQHQLATSVERMLAAEMGVSWMEYEQANLDLYNPPTIAPEANVPPNLNESGCANAQPPDVALEDAVDKLTVCIRGSAYRSETYVKDILRRFADAIRNRA